MPAHRRQGHGDGIMAYWFIDTGTRGTCRAGHRVRPDRVENLRSIIARKGWMR